MKKTKSPATRARRKLIAAGASKARARKAGRAAYERQARARAASARIQAARKAKRKADRLPKIRASAKMARKASKRRAGNAAANRACDCGPARPERVRPAKGRPYTMCRDERGVTRKRSGKRRHPGSFSKRADC